MLRRCRDRRENITDQVFDTDDDGWISIDDIEAVLEKPSVKQLEAQTGADFLDMLRHFEGDKHFDADEFHAILSENAEAIAGSVHGGEVPSVATTFCGTPRTRSTGGWFFSLFQCWTTDTTEGGSELRIRMH